MIRFIGLLIGGLMLADGAFMYSSPRESFRVWEKRKLKEKVPREVETVVKDLSKLPDRAIRYFGFWEAAMGALVLFFAARAR